MHLRLLSFIVLIGCLVWLESSASCFDEEDENIEQILSYPFEQANLKFFEATLKEPHPEKKACISYHHGKLCYSNGDTKLAKEIWENAFYQFQKSKVVDSLLLHRLIYNSAITQLNDRHYSEAIKNFKLAINYVSNPIDQSKCYVKIGTCYEEAGEYTLSNYYYQLATKDKSVISLENNKWLSIAYGQIAVNYSALQAADSTLKYAQLQIETAKNLPSEQRLYNEMYSYLTQGNAYETKEEYKKAIEHYNKSLSIAENLNNDNYIFRSLSNIGYTYNQLQQQEKALNYLSRAKNIALKMEDSSQVAATINTIGDIYYNAGNFEKSTRYYLNAFNYLLGSNNGFNYNLLPNTKIVENLDYLGDVFVYVKFISKSMIAESKSKNDQSIMLSALQYIHFADSLLFMVNQNTLDNSSKFYWREQATELYGYALEAANFINNQSELFYFIERGKYFVLQELMEENIRLSQLSPKLQAKLQTIKEDISAIEIKKALSALNQNDLASLIQLKEQYHAITDSLYHTEATNSTYINNTSLNQLQTDFLNDKNSLYVSYLEGKTSTYALFVTKDSSWLKIISHSNDYLNTKAEFLNSASRPFNTTADLNNYYTSSNQLYNQLTTTTFAQYSNIIINPSGTLNFIPFDALCTDISNQKLVIHTQTVRYTLSPSIELQQEKSVTSHKTSTLFVAPVSFMNQNISDLINSQKEVQQIRRAVGGKVLMERKASKSFFKNQINHYNGVHFATHAMASNEENNLPWIAFHDEKMYLPEIYNLPLKDKFVVLSACETFRGDLISGEGIMNLVWGIHSAGSKSVVATLWNTYDKASEELMQDFYSYLKKGDKKEVALRKAKLDYIEKHGMKPNQWAPFIYIGESSAIEYKDSNHLILYILGALALISLLSIVFLKIKKQSKV
ncbi:MAG: CHAT domain-containing tetratricopeptide repeat protein [Chitinophagales bacterium]